MVQLPQLQRLTLAEFAGKYVAAALLSAPTIEKGGVEILPNIKFKQVMQKMALTDVLSDASCDFTKTDDAITLTERVLEVKDLQVNLEICKLDFHNTWQGVEQGYSSFDVLPKSFEDYMIGYVAEKVAARNEVNFWRGDKNNSGEYDGIVTQVALDAGLPAAQEIAGVAASATTIIDELGKIVDALPASVFTEARIYSSIFHKIWLVLMFVLWVDLVLLLTTLVQMV